jgi:hypothetical protein
MWIEDNYSWQEYMRYQQAMNSYNAYKQQFGLGSLGYGEPQGNLHAGCYDPFEQLSYYTSNHFSGRINVSSTSKPEQKYDWRKIFRLNPRFLER